MSCCTLAALATASADCAGGAAVRLLCSAVALFGPAAIAGAVAWVGVLPGADAFSWGQPASMTSGAQLITSAHRRTFFSKNKPAIVPAHCKTRKQQMRYHTIVRGIAI